MLCWGFGMWKVKPQTPPAPTVISPHAPLSKPESHILLQHSQTRKTQQLACQPKSDPLLQDVFCEQQSLFTPTVCSTWKVPLVGCGWEIRSRRMGMTARESPFSSIPKPICYQLQKTGLALSPLSALLCSHTSCGQSRFTACCPQENPWDFLLGQVSTSLPQGCVKSWSELNLPVSYGSLQNPFPFRKKKNTTFLHFQNVHLWISCGATAVLHGNSSSLSSHPPPDTKEVDRNPSGGFG